jgi:hypothetical protein
MIRAATQNDIPELTALVLSFFSHDELADTGLTPDPLTIEFFVSDILENPDYTILVSDVDGVIIGAIAGFVAPWMFNADIITLAELGWFIPKEHRNNLMAAMQLRRAFHKWGKERGATVLIMVSTTREESPRVRQFYEKSGLRHIDSNYIGRL